MTGDALFTAAELGAEFGKRVERVEWGLRETVGTYLTRKGHVEPRNCEENARQILEAVARGECPGWGNIELVRRTVVTYTTRWEAA